MRRSTGLLIAIVFIVFFFVGYAVLLWPRTLPRLKVLDAQFFSGYTIVTLRNISGQDLYNVTVVGTIMRDSYHFDVIHAKTTFDVRLYGTVHTLTVLYADGLTEELKF